MVTPQTPGVAAHGAAATPGQHLADKGKVGRGRMDGDSGGVETAAVPPCTRLDPELFFPEAYDLHGQQEAARVCATCPVRQACYVKAVEAHETSGVWGGVLFDNSKRRKVAVSVPAPPPPSRPVPAAPLPDPAAQTRRKPLRTIGGKCKRGHLLVGENVRTRWDRPGVVSCRECNRTRKRDRRDDNRDRERARQATADSRARRETTLYGRDVCPVCRQMVALTAGGTVRRHGPKDATCPGSNSWPVAEKRAAS